MEQVKIEKCPFCGGEEFIEGYMGSYGGVVVSCGACRNASVSAVVCRNCGSIVRTYCKDPEKLYPRKERKNNS